MSIQRDENRLRNGTTAVNLTPRVHIDFFFLMRLPSKENKWMLQNVLAGENGNTNM